LASVDLWGHRVRRSFGTALKPFSLAAPGASLAMLAAALALGFTSPSIQPAREVGHAYGWDSRALQARAMDASVWFAGLLERFN